MIGAVLNHYGAQAALKDGMEVLVDLYVHPKSGALTIASSLREWRGTRGAKTQPSNAPIQGWLKAREMAWTR